MLLPNGKEEVVCPMHRMVAIEIETQKLAKKYDWQRPRWHPTDWMSRARK